MSMTEPICFSRQTTNLFDHGVCGAEVALDLVLGIEVLLVRKLYNLLHAHGPFGQARSPRWRHCL